MYYIVWCGGYCFLLRFIVLIRCLSKCIWFLLLRIWKFCGKLVFIWCVCSRWCVRLWNVFIYILFWLVFINWLIWWCIFVVVLLVKVIVMMEYGELFFMFSNQVIWCISMWVFLFFVFVNISMLLCGVVIVLCCLLLRLLSR